MNLKEIYNPKHVYEGYFEYYFIRPFFHHYADLKGNESGGSFAMSLLAWITVTLGICGLLMGLVGLLGPEVGFSALIYVSAAWGLFSLCPLVSLVARAFNGVPEQRRKPRLLAVDTLMGVSCLLFFILGLLMMTTTLHSGSLNPNAGMTTEEDTAVSEEEYVKEEPIFTYQDENAGAGLATDTMNDVTEPDLVEAEESFDPTLNTPDEIIEDPETDTLLF